MEKPAYYESIVNSVSEHIVIINDKGDIEFTNAGWNEFGLANDCDVADSESWTRINYLDVCDASAKSGEPDAGVAAEGARQIIDGKLEAFYHEYPCHSPTEKRWFMMRVTLLQWPGSRRIVISHQNITERKLIEEKLQMLSLSDGLTGIPNRRHFDEFLESEWRRALRLESQVSLALLDVDHFKLYNDHYGHSVGDECLRKISSAIADVANRPSDLCARYGGEEFALIMGATGAENAMKIADHMRRAVESLNIPHEASPAGSIVTASVGVATMPPFHLSDQESIIQAADKALYQSKQNGRNQLTFFEEQNSAFS